MLFIKNNYDIIITINDNPKKIKVPDLSLDSEVIMFGDKLFDGCVKFDYAGSSLRIPIKDYTLVKEGDLTAVHLEVSPEWEKKLIAFTN